MAIYARLENGTYAEVTGVYKTDGTEITEIFKGDRLVYSATNEIYGTVPLYYDGLGYELIDYLISGNAVQDGTPSPDAPVDAVGCGTRTENLWDEDYTGISGSLKYVPVYVGNGSFTLSTSCSAIDGVAALFFLAGNVQSGASTVSNGVYKNRPITVASSNGYVTVVYRYVSYATGSSDPRNEKTMLNLGSTALPYEPYGYKLDISSGGENLWDPDSRMTNQVGSAQYGVVLPAGVYTLTNNSNTSIYCRDGYSSTEATTFAASGQTKTMRFSKELVAWTPQKQTQIMLNLGSTAKPYSPYNRTATPIYLGTVPTTRRIKKLVLTGEESITLYTYLGRHGVAVNNILERNYTRAKGICTHYPVFSGDMAANVLWIGVNNRVLYFIAILDTLGISTADEFKAYLAAQYQNGTPVTVWYVLATEETAIVNEPLMKIGDYADTVSAAQAGVTIPTINGENILDMTSPVKPSEVYIKGKGIKPTGYGQLGDVNNVNILDKDGNPIYVHGQ